MPGHHLSQQYILQLLARRLDGRHAAKGPAIVDSGGRGMLAIQYLNPGSVVVLAGDCCHVASENSDDRES